MFTTDTNTDINNIANNKLKENIMLKPVKHTAFELRHWLLTQRANWLTYKANQAVADYKRKRGLK